jgi:hypothetical protein
MIATKPTTTGRTMTRVWDPEEIKLVSPEAPAAFPPVPSPLPEFEELSWALE